MLDTQDLIQLYQLACSADIKAGDAKAIAAVLDRVERAIAAAQAAQLATPAT